MTLSTGTAGDGERAVDLSRLRSGETVEAHTGSVVLHRGTVEETMPHLGVLWIREDGTGARRMLSQEDAALRRC